VHHLRKAGKAHRGFRPGVLAPAAAATAAALLAALALAGCTARPTSPAAASLPGAAWFQAAAATFNPIPSPAAASPVPARPWTVQSRVADMAFLGDTLYLALNGSGLATLALDASGTPTFTYHADQMIFAHRTITTLVPRQNTMAVHLYFNALLNDVKVEDLTLAGISLVSFLPDQSQYAFLVPPFQRKNADWEAAGFAAESENSFDMEWKYAGASETRFAYTRFHADTRAEETVSRDVYQAALGVPAVTGAAVSADLASFFEACRAHIPSLDAATALQFSLRLRESPVRRNYRSRPEAEEAVQVPVYEEKGERTALLPNGTLLIAAPGVNPRVVTLPALPPGSRYTDVVRTAGRWVVAWESVSFTDVGAAGLLIARAD
jgi:hypothetical protein